MSAYYNEIDPFAAAWLRELIKAKLIADGEVDERSIADVRADDLRGFRQCHFFAGIGGWSYALRLAGWPDERDVWTGSCPCQPFSEAGSGRGTDDPRHLWPTWVRLIGERRPSVVFGEQVASADGRAWFDAVSTDVEAMDYAVAAVDICAAGVGAPHRRQRLYFVANAAGERHPREWLQLQRGQSRQHQPEALRRGETLSVADAISSEWWPHTESNVRIGRDAGREETNGNAIEPERSRDAGDVGNADEAGPQGRFERVGPDQWALRATGVVGVLGGFWSDAEWLYGRDEKWRAVEPGTFPLAARVPARVGRIGGYGNAIVPQVAQVFIEAYMSIGASDV